MVIKSLKYIFLPKWRNSDVSALQGFVSSSFLSIPKYLLTAKVLNIDIAPYLGAHNIP